MAAQIEEMELSETPTKTVNVPADSSDPLNWPDSRKWVVTASLSVSSFNRIMVSTIMAPALPSIASSLNLSTEQSVAALGAFVLATAVSPLVAAPLSEMYGRAPILHFTNVWFLAFNIMCGFANNGAALIAGRVLAGLGAGAIYALASGVMGDLWPPERRGTTLAIYLLVPLLGAAAGPIIGGLVDQYTTWRWIFWSTSALQAVTVATCMFWFKETHLATIRSRRKFSFLAFERAVAPKMALPLKQLLRYRSIQLQALLSGFGYGILYLVISTYSSLFTSVYHESTAISGLHYIALCLGEIIGSQIAGRLGDALARKVKRRAQSERFEPEFHLPIVGPGVLISAIGFLLYGWAAERQVHWAVVDLGVLILCIGTQCTGQGLQAYNMDSYPDARASSAAAVQVFRSLGAFGLPLLGPRMYESIGYGWANTMLAGAYVGGNLGAAAVLWKFGPRLR